MALGNTCLIQNFLGGVDEEWFILVHLEIEAQAGPALAAIFPAQQAAAEKNEAVLEKELQTMERALHGMYTSLLRMPEKCDPYIYYHRVRPYIHGWRDHPLFTEGLLYSDVSDYNGQPQRFRGETGAQSSIIPSLDAALGIEHKDDYMRHYLNEMKDYMPPKHRAFIAAIEKGSSIRELVIERSGKNKSLENIYNKCVHWMELFRSKHLEYANEYIFKQYESSQTNPHAVGTGGTPFMPYLTKHRDETAAHILSEDKAK
jgi:indoleamine 2,3-dioxygenase